MVSKNMAIVMDGERNARIIKQGLTALQADSRWGVWGISGCSTT